MKEEGPIDFEELLREKACFVPQLEHALDTTYFDPRDHYARGESEDDADPEPDELFKNFDCVHSPSMPSTPLFVSALFIPSSLIGRIVILLTVRPLSSMSFTELERPSSSLNVLINVQPPSSQSSTRGHSTSARSSPAPTGPAPALAPAPVPPSPPTPRSRPPSSAALGVFPAPLARRKSSEKSGSDKSTSNSARSNVSHFADVSDLSEDSRAATPCLLGCRRCRTLRVPRDAAGFALRRMKVLSH